MIYISDKQQSRIKRKMMTLPQCMRSQTIGIVFFQIVGVIILSYGICVGKYLHPIDDRKPNPTHDYLISCFFYFAVSVAAPFSGGHLNPAVTAAFIKMKKGLKVKFYIISQIIGALLGTTIAYFVVDVVPFFYTQQQQIGSLILDGVAEVFGTFVFIFFILLTVETNYISGEYFKYLLLAIFLLAGRTFTLRKGCLNPAIAIAFQLYAAIDRLNWLLLLNALALIIGSLIGGFLAYLVFNKFYLPLKEGLALQRSKQSQSLESFHSND